MFEKISTWHTAKQSVRRSCRWKHVDESLDSGWVRVLSMSFPFNLKRLFYILRRHRRTEIGFRVAERNNVTQVFAVKNPCVFAMRTFFGVRGDDTAALAAAASRRHGADTVFAVSLPCALVCTRIGAPKESQFLIWRYSSNRVIQRTEKSGRDWRTIPLWSIEW